MHSDSIESLAQDPAAPWLLSLQQIAAWQFPALAPNKESLPILAGIPSLQRGAVWSPGQVELLWDSMFRGFPIGSLVVCARNPAQRTRSGRHGRGWEDDDITHHLLDGQQRCNAIALGFLDPFDDAVDLEKDKAPPAVLWIDLAPRRVKESTRQFWFRVLTTAHPWGYQRSDTAERLGVAEIRNALNEYGMARRELAPHLAWPPVGDHAREPGTPLPSGASRSQGAPIPLAWLLKRVFGQTGLSMPTDSRTLWQEIRELCRIHGDTPWAQAALAAIDPDNPSPHLRQIIRGLAHARRFQIVALAVPSEEERASEEEVTPDGISDIEHLFQRLNSGGTRLQGEELAFSMIKAYWPGIERSFAALGNRPMAEAHLATLGIRAAQIGSEGKANTLPPALSVTAVRSLARQENKETQRQQVKNYLGLQDPDADQKIFHQSDLHRNLGQIDAWLLFNKIPGDYGLPPVLRTGIAQNAPEVFLLLLHLAQEIRTRTLPADTIADLRKPLLALTTTLHWFGEDRARAVKYVFQQLQTRNPALLGKETFRGILAGCIELKEEENRRGILRVLSPTALRQLTPEALANDELAQWRLWNLMVGSITDKAKRRECEQFDWPFFYRVKSSKALLLYAQRDYLCRRFQDYDPSLPDTWKEHNRPWDYDHILPAAITYNKKSQNRFKWACDEWMNTIGNFRAWPLEDNRAKSDELANATITSPEDMNDSLLQASDLDHFSLTPADLDDAAKSAAFMNAARERLLRIYTDWYDSLEIGYLF